MSARCRDNPDECDRNYCQREKKCAERAASAPFSFVPDKGRQFDTEHPFSLPTNEQGRAAEGAVAECENCNQLVRALREATESPTFMGEPVSQLPSASNWVWQHIKSKGEYRLLGDAKIQTDTPLNDMFDVRVYQGDDGALWVRPTTEFNGKFKRLRPATQPPSASPVAVPMKRWPFVESPGEFTERLCVAIRLFGDLLPAVRNVLIENPAQIKQGADGPLAESDPAVAILKEQLNSCVATLVGYYKADAQISKPSIPASMTASINHAHSLALELETLLYWVGKSSPNQDSAFRALEAYRKEFREAQEVDSPTFMGESATQPALPDAGLDSQKGV